MQMSLSCRTTPISVWKMHLTGQTAMHGASVQCMHAIDMDFSPGSPSPIVTSRRLLMPHGTSCSFLHAAVHALHSMHRSASQRNFMRGMARSCFLDSAEGRLGLLHGRDRVVAVGGGSICGLADHKGDGSFWISPEIVCPIHQPAEWKGLKKVPAPTRLATSGAAPAPRPSGRR